MFSQTIIIGHLGKDPETRSLPSGLPVANFSVATSEKWKDKETGEKKERTEWFNCAAFGRTAEVVSEYLTKGSLVQITGRLQTDVVESRDGNGKKYFTELRVDRLTMLGSPRNAQAGSEDQSDDDRDAGGTPEGFDDDIPF